MIKLSGILEYSMGGFLCLRGFASYKMLSAISKPDTEVQRGLIDEHKGDMARFLNAGEYRFFPEVILATNLTDGTKDFDEVGLFHESLQSGQTWNKCLPTSVVPTKVTALMRGSVKRASDSPRLQVTRFTTPFGKPPSS